MAICGSGPSLVSIASTGVSSHLILLHPQTPGFPPPIAALAPDRIGGLWIGYRSKPTPSAVADKAGLLWFATSGHLVSIDPASVRTEEATRNVLVQSVLINGSVVRYADGLPLTEDGRRLRKVQFEYIGVNLDAPDRVTYQYMLEPLEKEWQEGGIRGEQSYANVAPNDYRFRVRAASGTGRWSEMASPLQLKVLPAFYRTKWFYVMCTLSLGGLLWCLYHLRVRYLTAQMREHLEARAHERLRTRSRSARHTLAGCAGISAALPLCYRATARNPSVRCFARPSPVPMR